MHACSSYNMTSPTTQARSISSNVPSRQSPSQLPYLHTYLPYLPWSSSRDARSSKEQKKTSSHQVAHSYSLIHIHTYRHTHARTRTCPNQIHMAPARPPARPPARINQSPSPGIHLSRHLGSCFCFAVLLLLNPLHAGGSKLRPPSQTPFPQEKKRKELRPDLAGL